MAVIRFLILGAVLALLVYGIYYLWKNRAVKPSKLYEEYLRYCLGKERIEAEDWQKLDQIEFKSGMDKEVFENIRAKYDVKRPDRRDLK